MGFTSSYQRHFCSCSRFFIGGAECFIIFYWSRWNLLTFDVWNISSFIGRGETFWLLICGIFRPLKKLWILFDLRKWKITCEQVKVNTNWHFNKKNVWFEYSIQNIFLQTAGIFSLGKCENYDKRDIQAFKCMNLSRFFH